MKPTSFEDLHDLLQRLFAQKGEPYYLHRDEGVIVGWKLTNEGFYGPIKSPDYAVSYNITNQAEKLIKARLKEMSMALEEIDPYDDEVLAAFDGVMWNKNYSIPGALGILGPEDIGLVLEMLIEGCECGVNYYRINEGDPFEEWENRAEELAIQYPLVKWSDLTSEEMKEWLDRLFPLLPMRVGGGKKKVSGQLYEEQTE